jgi:predicted HAD superfamily phosphohydrolase YqeG
LVVDGDRLFTDVLAGNRLGMFTILVEPMVEHNEVARSYSLRNLEVWISKQLGVSLHHAQHDFQSLSFNPKENIKLSK